MDSQRSPRLDSAQPALPPEGSTEVWWVVELFCWTVVLLALFLPWINGPAVSTDQWLVRVALVCPALAEAVTLRALAIARAMRRRRSPPQSGSA